jgi:Cupin superfamily protein
MTPAQGKGFDTHYDTHDTVLLQVAGSKEWTIFDTPIRLPLVGQPFDKNLHPIGGPTMSFVLNAGDCVYIPRGFLHHGRSRDEISLHATIGVLSYRWSDVLLEAMAQLCLSDAEFRRALPVNLGCSDFDVSSTQRTCAELLSRVAKQLNIESVLERFADEFAVSRRAFVPRQFEQVALAPKLSVDDYVGVRPAAIYRLHSDREFIRIRSQGRELKLSAEAADAVKFALNSSHYRIRDLPGALYDDDKLTIVRRLIEEGLVWRLS